MLLTAGQILEVLNIPGLGATLGVLVALILAVTIFAVIALILVGIYFLNIAFRELAQEDAKDMTS